MGALLAKHRFAVTRDESLPTIGAGLSADMGQATRLMKHMHIATADRPHLNAHGLPSQASLVAAVRRGRRRGFGLSTSRELD